MDIKLSQLPEAASSTPLDYFMVVQNGVNKKITLSNLLKTLDSIDNIQLNPSRNPINVRLSSSNSLNLFYLDGVADFIGINTDSPQARLHISGDVKIGNDTNLDGVLLNSSEEITYTTAIDLPQGINWYKPLNAAREMSTMIVEAGVTSGKFLLGNGLPGQYKTLTAVSLPSGSNAIVKTTSGVGYQFITFPNEGSSVVLRCVLINSLPKWVVLGNYLTTFTS